MANLVLDRRQQKAHFKNHDLALNSMEFEVLWILSAFKGRTMSLKHIVGLLDDAEVDSNVQQLGCVIEGLGQKLPGHQITNKENGCVFMSA